MALQGTAAPLPPFPTLYVGDLDPSVKETDLLVAFGCFAPVSARVVRDRTSGRSLRYAYINFPSFNHAAEARRVLNHTRLHGKSIRVMWSQRYPPPRKISIGNLFVKNLDVSWGGAELESLFAAHGAVVSCKVAEDESGMSKGFGFVQMDSDEAAQRAIGALNGVLLNGRRKPLYVSKFIKKSERQAPPEKPKPTNLYIKNLECDFTDDRLRDEFSKFGEVISAVVMKYCRKSSCFGFVCFKSPEHAKKAIMVMNGARLGTKIIYVGLAQKKAERQQQLKRQSAERHEKLWGSVVYIKNPDSYQSSYCFPQCGLPQYQSGIQQMFMQQQNSMDHSMGYKGFQFFSSTMPHYANDSSMNCASLFGTNPQYAPYLSQLIHPAHGVNLLHWGFLSQLANTGYFEAPELYKSQPASISNFKAPESYSYQPAITGNFEAQSSYDYAEVLKRIYLPHLAGPKSGSSTKGGKKKSYHCWGSSSPELKAEEKAAAIFYPQIQRSVEPNKT